MDVRMEPSASAARGVLLGAAVGAVAGGIVALVATSMRRHDWAAGLGDTMERAAQMTAKGRKLLAEGRALVAEGEHVVREGRAVIDHAFAESRRAYRMLRTEDPY